MFTEGEKQKKAAALKVLCGRLGIIAVDSMKMIVVLHYDSLKENKGKKISFSLYSIAEEKTISVIKLSFASESSSLGSQATRTSHGP